ncbi:hypothetical protein, partial [Chondromyces apiculatus]|uniref:hypothetical protein n=1 Tax=Chondromyces apiculatus TaxID=51 RepID=UPI0005C59415
MVKAALRRVASFVPGRRALGVGALVVGVLGAGIVLGPKGMVGIGREKASSCLAAVEAPRGAALPACGEEMRWFSLPSRLPWSFEEGSLLGEELQARVALAAYMDAAVGRPDRGALDEASGGLQNAERLVSAGSQRLRFEELGTTAPVPKLGREAIQIGDRRTLMQLGEQWGEWHVRVAALRAALQEGDLTRAGALAARYAEFDPRDEDLRGAVASVLCLGDGAKRGMEMLTLTQGDRAARRYAGMARDWGDVRALMVACAARAGVEPPPRPEKVEAGEDHRDEVRIALALRLAAGRGDGG